MKILQTSESRKEHSWQLRICFFIIAFMSNFYMQLTAQDYIYTVNGKIDTKDLKFSLIHEHVMSNFGAKASLDPGYDSLSLCRQVIPYLLKVKSQGVYSIFDCTTAYFGRDVSMLKTLSDATGLQIITNTGFYGAADDRYVPAFAYDKSIEEIAEIWINEFEYGIGNTGVRPGFIKLAFDSGEPSMIDVKLFKAGIRTHLSTGLTMVVHTSGNIRAANEQLKLLKESGVDPTSWVWAHAHNVADLNVLIDAAANGAWISLDGINASNTTEFISKTEKFREKGLLHKILLSHDGNSFPRGGEIRPYDAIQTVLVPALKDNGFSSEEIDLLMIKNPQNAFAIEVHYTE